MSQFVVFGLLWSCVLLPSSVLASQSQDDPLQEQKVAGSSLVYVSDYFSFIGRDERGHVAFVVDTNRGKDGADYQAEHFTLLHAEHQGWVALQGNGAYENAEKTVMSIPNSPMFQFEGNVETGMVIRSQPNVLSLSVDPLSQALSRTHNQGQYWMGSAPATLQWGERNVTGRVIYEYVFMLDFNRLTRTYWGLWKEFQGFYLSVNGVGDLYLHSQQSEQLSPLIGTLDGFLSIEEQVERLQLLQLTPLSYSQALGLYQWPKEWSVRWLTKGSGGSVRLELSEFHRVSSWILGGFAMGIVSGKAFYKEKTFQVYGLVELLM